MRIAAPHSLRNATFRTSPRFELVSLDRLLPHEREGLKGLTDDPELYGILRPASESARTITAVSRDAAQLFSLLRDPGPLPVQVRSPPDGQCERRVARLVLDGVLEVEHDGQFVSGAAACALVGGDQSSSTADAVTRITRVSTEALRYAQALAADDVPALAARLYLYGRRPLSPAWARRLSTPQAVAEYLGIEVGPGARTLHRYWHQVRDASPHDAWLVWEPRAAQRLARQRGAVYKLYVSPAPEQMREGFCAAVSSLSTLDPPPAFKVGKDVHGLMRPDKMVVYCVTRDAMEAAADRLRHQLAGIRAHGVPFTANLAGEGLLSWGMDPPEDHRVLGWQQRESWRLWVTTRLAAFLLAAKACAARAVEPWQFAVCRLRLEGVDTDSWTPAAGLWGGESGME